jgi:glycosyltransferase involved in cell wall biosynthesis
MAELRVVHLVPALFGPRGVVGGAERYAYELAKAMATQVRTKLVTFGQEPGIERDGALEIRILGKVRQVRGQASNPISTEMFAALREASLVHCHQQHVLASSLAAAYCRLSGRKVFVSDLGGGGWDISAYLSTDRWYHGHLHISEYSRRVFGHEHNRWAHVILGGVDTEKFSPGGTERVGEDVLFVGRILPHKGINYLVEALPDDMRLIVVGPPDDERFVTDIRGLAASKQVVFRHGVADSELVRLYRSALCVVLPSVYETMYGQRTEIPELLGQTLLEGMSCGIPGLCTDVASLPEVVENKVSGFVVAPNDSSALREALLRLRGDRERTAQMGMAARKRVLETFTWASVVRRCLHSYGVPLPHRRDG